MTGNWEHTTTLLRLVANGLQTPCLVSTVSHEVLIFVADYTNTMVRVHILLARISVRVEIP